MWPSVGPDFPVFLLATFDPEECTLSGSAVFFDIKGMDTFVWYVFDGGAMHGDYVAALNDTLLFPKVGRHDVRYVG